MNDGSGENRKLDRSRPRQPTWRVGSRVTIDPPGSPVRSISTGLSPRTSGRGAEPIVKRTEIIRALIR